MTDANTYFNVLEIVPHRIQTDGTGVTTLVALSGCPLKCKYCINKRILSRKNARKMTLEELYSSVSGDFCYFLATNGGITFGGGEPLLQYTAIKEFRQTLPDWIAVNVETSLNVPGKAVEELLPHINEWIIDIKTLDDELYKDYTGTERTNAINNLRLLAETVPDKCRIRIPVIPFFKTEVTALKEETEIKRMGFKNTEVFQYVIKNETN